MTERPTILLEDTICNGLEELRTETDPTKRDKKVNEIVKLINAANAIDHENFEYFDKQARRELEKEKNDALVAAEEKKSSITWSKVLFEVGGKTILPLLIQILAFAKFQDVNLEFEKTGRKVSWMSKEMHLPKFWK